MINRHLWHIALFSALCIALNACGGSDSASSSNDEFAVQLQRVFGNLTFSRPVAMLQAPGDNERFYVVEKGGDVRVFDNDPAVTTTALFFDDSNDRVDAGSSESGLLGMAFHPEFAMNATVYLSYTRTGAGPPLVSYVSAYNTVNGSIDANSEQPLLTVDQPYSNHNGGNIAFGPDGHLYIGLGDGGSGGDPDGNGQDTGTLLGAMLRIDVDNVPMGDDYGIPPDNPFAASAGCNDAGCREIYAWGLRNPWRWSFDRVNGDLWLGDVGQNRWEEVDLVRNGDNLGWNEREGAHCYPPSETSCQTAGLVDPRAEYDRDDGYSITGGYVYRGSALPALIGHYVYGDYGSGRIWALDTGDSDAQPVLLMNTSLSISSFAEDQAGELYVLDYSAGGIHKLVASK